MQSHLFGSPMRFAASSERKESSRSSSGKSNRKKRIRHDEKASKKRNVIARCFARLEDVRRIATRHDKRAGETSYPRSVLLLAPPAGFELIKSGP